MFGPEKLILYIANGYIFASAQRCGTLYQRLCYCRVETLLDICTLTVDLMNLKIFIHYVNGKFLLFKETPSREILSRSLI
jgi:hypothetical protein